MAVVLWFLTAILVYLALGRWVFLVSESARQRRPGHILLLLVGTGTAVAAARYLGGYLAGGPGQAGRIQTLLLIFCAVLWIWGLVQDSLTRGKLTWQDVRRRREALKQVRLHLALITGALIFSVPLYWLVTTSLKPDERTNVFPPDILPMRQATAHIDGEDRKVYLVKHSGRQVRVVRLAELADGNVRVQTVGLDEKPWAAPAESLKPELHPCALWSNYSEALDFLPSEYNRGLRPLWNTIWVTLLSIVGTLFSSSLVAFSFSRLRWPARDMFFVVMLSTMMVPAAVTMLPVFLIFRSLGWVDTLGPLWFPAFFGSGFSIFLLRQFFLTIPNELEDAAKIDGASYFRIYWMIMLPLIKPALAALTVFAFMGAWNNFMGPLIYISSPEKMTLAYALQLFQGMHGGEPAMMMAAATLMMLPVLIVFFFTQRYMIEGITLTGLKG